MKLGGVGTSTSSWLKWLLIMMFMLYEHDDADTDHSLSNTYNTTNLIQLIKMKIKTWNQLRNPSRHRIIIDCQTSPQYRAPSNS